MNYEQQLEELQQRINNTEDFIERMSLQGELEDIEVRAGIKLPPKPLDSIAECFGCGS